MKKRLVFVFLLLVPVVGALFHTCCPCDKETQHEYYSHKTMFLKNLDNSGEYVIESESSQLNKNAYGIRLCLEREVIVATYSKRQFNSMFIQSAYATSCVCPPEFINHPIDSIVSIKIITVNDFDNQYLENSDVTDCFRIAGSFSEVDDYVAGMQYDYTYDYADNFEYYGRNIELDFLLMIPPKANNKQQFEVQLILSDGRILKQQTLEIELL
ncbi:hypothetical protein M2138_000309 [Dysgonomonadaceae bacterium PH5-43]|nr:hypothetical protein [Dysgonomonadaceae bacterium PH5-43]